MDTLRIISLSTSDSTKFLMNVTENFSRVIEIKSLKAIKKMFYGFNDFLQLWDLSSIKNNSQITCSSFVPLLNHTRRYF